MRRAAAVLLAMLMAAMSVLPASAMTFQMLERGDQRQVIASGEIDDGDARRLERALDLATRDSHGTKDLLLNSPGGLVDEAFAMADIMDHVGVTTIVPSGAYCASACASVLFVSGKYRTVDKGGSLIIHSCFDARNGQPMADCDAVISAHAQAEGVSGVAMMAFQEVAGTHSAFLFDKADAACFGLTRAPGTAASTKIPPCLAAAMKAAKKH